MRTGGYVTKLFLEKSQNKTITTKICQSTMNYVVEHQCSHGGNRRHDPFPSSNEPCGQEK